MTPNIGAYTHIHPQSFMTRMLTKMACVAGSACDTRHSTGGVARRWSMVAESPDSSLCLPSRRSVEYQRKSQNPLVPSTDVNEPSAVRARQLSRRG